MTSFLRRAISSSPTKEWEERRTLGEQLLKRALEKERSNDRKGAIEHYQSGLELLMECLRTAPHARRTILRAKIDRWMGQAERLKAGPKKAVARPRVGRPPVRRAGSKPSLHKPRPKAAPKPAPKPQSAVDPRLRDHIEGEILVGGKPVSFEDVIGLEDAKQTLYEMVVLPAFRPDIFTGLRAPPRGLLLFGPPGNGKTLIARAVASQSKMTFFSVSASTLVSRFMGEGEKLVRALFAVARERQPAIIFIDELDSMLGARGSREHEASRRLKTEFLVQFDGASTDAEERVTVIGATNCPELLDHAVIRRFQKRIYVGMPDASAREQLLCKLLKGAHSLSRKDIATVVKETAGYSGSDLCAVCKDAAMGPVRELDPKTLEQLPKERVPKIQLRHLQRAVRVVRPSVPRDKLLAYQAWGQDAGVDVTAAAAPPKRAAANGRGKRERAQADSPANWVPPPHPINRDQTTCGIE